MNENLVSKARLRRLPVIAAVSIGVLLTAAAWLWAHGGHAPLPPKGVVVDYAKGLIFLSKESREGLDVRTAEISNRPLPEKLLAYAMVEAPWQQHAFASSRLSGRIETLPVRAGQSVEAGQVLAEVRSVELEALQFELLNARSESELSSKVLKGLEDAATSGSIPAQQILEARVKHQQNLNALDITQSKWLSLGLSRDAMEQILKEGRGGQGTTLPIRSPIGGTVIHADLSVGRVVEASEHLFEIVDLSTVWVKIGVLEKDLRRVEVGQPVEIQLTAYPGKTFDSKIMFTAPFLDTRTHLNTVWARLDNNGSTPTFLPGMAGQAQIVLPTAKSAKTIPADALINDGVDRYVLVEEAKATGKSEYRKRSVVVLRETPEWVEIQSADLLPGDRVVTQGSMELGGLLAPGVLKLTPQMEQSIGLRVEAVQSRIVEDVVALEGIVEVPPDQRGFASTQLAGTLHAIRIEPGQQVKTGQVVAEIASLELQHLQMELLKEHSAYQLAKEVFEQLERNVGAASARMLLESENSMVASRNRRDSVRRRLEVLGLSTAQLDALVTDKKPVQTLPVRSPIAGSAGNLDKILGQTLRAEEALVEVHNLTKPWVHGFVSERDLQRIGPHKSVRVRFVGDPNTMFTGKVARSAMVFAAPARALSLWIELDEYPASPLQHNQLARINLTVDRPAASLAVPLGAIAREGTQTFVFVRQKDGVFERRGVVLGRSDDQWTEVISGLRAGEEIAVSGTAELQTAYASLR